MKKVLFFAIILGSSLAFTSCSKKDFTCTCKVDVLGVSTSTETVFEGVKESEAETACNASNSAAGVTCTLSEK